MCGGEESLDPGYDRQEQTAASENCGSGGGKEGIFLWPDTKTFIYILDLS